VQQYPITVDGELPDEEQIERWLAGSGFCPMPVAADRDAWADVAQRPHVRDALPALRERAERIAEQGPGMVKATDYLDFFRTGRRDAHRSSASARAGRLSLLTAVECLDHEGRFLDPLLDLSWAMAEETSWVMPPHLRHDDEDVLPDVGQPGVDLRVSMVARALGEMLYLLGEEMDAVSPAWRKRIRYELERQAVRPYLERGFFWEEATHNWNAVCTDGMVACALLGGFDRHTTARVLARAVRSALRFLSGFSADGGCSEGPGYWLYGVGHYASMAYYMRCATGGVLDLLADPIVPRIMAYPPKTVLSGPVVANFADCARTVRFSSGPVAWAASQVDVPQTVALASRGPIADMRVTTVLDLHLMPEPTPFQPPQEAFLPALMLLVARSEDDGALVLAVKGGHNGEHHNHNDVGTFIVHRLGESLICELGSAEYRKENFSPHRYEFLPNRSLGHNVPLINGCEQARGKEFGATEFRRQESRGAVGVAMELAGAYPAEAQLDSLERTVVLEREGLGRVELTDEVAFSRTEHAYELPLYSEGHFEAAGGAAAVARGSGTALRVEWDNDVLVGEIQEVPHGDRALAHRMGETVSCCRLRLRGDPDSVTVRLRFVPVRC
jgi:hypothetical protein